MIDEIMTLYKSLKFKTKFIKKLSLVVDKSPNYIRNHWFSGFNAIPVIYQETVLNEVKREIDLQKQLKKQLL